MRGSLNPKFELELLPRTHVTDELTPNGRVYHTPDGPFHSVTTVLGQYYDDSFLEEWKRRIGEEKAAKISRDARENGTRLHGCLEKFLMNQSLIEENSIEKMRFASVGRKLQGHVSKVFASELPLWSTRLQTAGRPDGIVLWDGKLAVIDLKTTNKYKREEYIESYFAQATCYGTMANEQFNMHIEKIVILFSTNEFDCYYFEKDMSDYVPLINKIFIERRNCVSPPKE